MSKITTKACSIVLLTSFAFIASCAPGDEGGSTAQTGAKPSGEQKQVAAANAVPTDRSASAIPVNSVSLTPTGEAAAQEAPPAPGNPAATPPPQPEPPGPEAYFLTAETTTVDMGDIPTNEFVTKTCKLTNNSEKPATIVRVQGSCGCTATNIPPNTIMQPHESRDMEIKVHGNPNPIPFTGKTVTVIVEGQPPITIKLTGQIVQFVKTEPAILNPDTHADGKLKLIAVDGSPFRITKMSPDIGLKFDDMKPAVEQEITLNWDKYKALPAFQPTYVYLDHPKCQQVLVQISFPPGFWPAPPKPVGNPNTGLITPNQEVSNKLPPPRVEEPLQAVITQIKMDDLDGLMKRIKDDGLSIEVADRNGTTLLGIAAQEGKVDIVKALLNAGADVNAVDRNGRTPLMAAASAKNPQVIYALLDGGANVGLRDQIGSTALSWTAFRGSPDCVQALLDAGADANIVTTTTGWTPLIWAAGFGDAATIPILVKAGAKLEIGDNLDGSTALIHAARTGKIECLQAMIKTGAKLEAVDNLGKTAFLSCAATSGGTVEKLKILAEAGANVHARDSRKQNALELARKRTDPRSEAIIAYLEPLLGAETSAEPSSAATGSSPAATVQKPTGTFTPTSQPSSN
ncbi:MAG TPA: ankyrin repeat domain-containing protein [Phycisphaerales bacterium]|nr:ankyrin repeat domain-containing protein [Phycisphaerales bacterium]